MSVDLLVLIVTFIIMVIVVHFDDIQNLLLNFGEVSYLISSLQPSLHIEIHRIGFVHLLYEFANCNRPSGFVIARLPYLFCHFFRLLSTNSLSLLDAFSLVRLALFDDGIEANILAADPKKSLKRDGHVVVQNILRIFWLKVHLCFLVWNVLHFLLHLLLLLKEEDVDLIQPEGVAEHENPGGNEADIDQTPEQWQVVKVSVEIPFRLNCLISVVKVPILHDLWVRLSSKTRWSVVSFIVHSILQVAFRLNELKSCYFHSL